MHVRASLDQDATDTLTEKEKKALCTAEGVEFDEAQLDALGCAKEAHKLGNPYQMDDCSNMLILGRLRPTCELDPPAWKAMSGGRTPPTEIDREKFIRDKIKTFTNDFKD